MTTATIINMNLAASSYFCVWYSCNNEGMAVTDNGKGSLPGADQEFYNVRPLDK